jgi:hypothetical protein
MIQAVADISRLRCDCTARLSICRSRDRRSGKSGTKLILVDTPPTDAEGNTVELPNVYSMTFKEEEGGFFAGIAAAMENKTNKVAVVNGLAYPSNVNYQWGLSQALTMRMPNSVQKPKSWNCPPMLEPM